jgi:hypothetical protein
VLDNVTELLSVERAVKAMRVPEGSSARFRRNLTQPNFVMLSTHFACRIKVTCPHSRAGGARDHGASRRASAPTFLERFGSEYGRYFGRMRTYKPSPSSARELVNGGLRGMARHRSFTVRRRDVRSHDVELYRRWFYIG